MPKILFTSPCGPYPKLPVDKDPIDYFYYRNTLKQGLFQLRSFQSWHSLHFMAQNIPIPSVVLENPDMKQFQKEVIRGNFDIIAIGFTILLSKKVLEMVSWVKETYPEKTIVLGGYGTAVFKETFEISEKLKGLSDYICYGEGLSEINSIIYQKWGIKNDKNLTQDCLPAINSFFRTRIQIFRQIVLIGGLGCVYGCSFCATSSQFNRKYIPLFTGKQLFESLLEQSKKYPKIQSAVIYDEDFLSHRPQVLEFIECFKSSVLSKRPFFITVFASVKSILNFSIEELIECGIGTIFIGVESLNKEVLEKESMPKRFGDVEGIFEQLHNHGINTLGSLVVGWDSQSIEKAKQDAKSFVALNPSFYQVIPLHIVPGTRLWEKMKNEGRIKENFDINTDSINEVNFVPKTYASSELLNIVSSTYRSLVDKGGPWPFRIFENALLGSTHLNKSQSPIQKQRAINLKKTLFPLCLLAFVSRALFFGKSFSKRWLIIMNLFMKTHPLKFMLSVALSPLVLMIISLIYVYGQLLFLLKNGDQPNYIRKEY